MASYKIEKSFIFTLLGITILFSTAIVVTLIAPRHVDRSWVSPSSAYQWQMYTIADPNFYISGSSARGEEPEFVYHLKQGFSLLAFAESETLKIEAPPELEKYITRVDDPVLKLTSRLLLLKRGEGNAYQLFDPQENEAFALTETEGVLESWVDKDYEILEEVDVSYHKDRGVIYVKNPEEYRIATYTFSGKDAWRYDPKGERIASLEDLRGAPFGFRSRKELIDQGETIYAHEGCFYCHTDQTRTIIQDLVLNGSDSYPAPPSSANEYIFQRITFPGTRRIGPDLSRVGVKRPHRDWHKSHFWFPQSESKGSIMPPFKHFFDDDPSGQVKQEIGIPNQQFEAIFQYLMTKGTRITPPTEAWWLGKDPIQTKLIIEGKKTVRK